MKNISEQIVVAMFGGTASKLNQIDLFQRFGLIAKTITFNSKGGHTEDMKLYRIDFNEMVRKVVVEDDGTERAITFEDSDLYTYFADNEFLCIMFQEAQTNSKNEDYSLLSNVFIGFKRLVFTDDFIDTKVRKLWEDTRDKIMNHKLVDIVCTNKDGTPRLLNNGDVSSAPNFLKGKENEVCIRGSGQNSYLKNKTECVNGIHMLPMYVWIKGLSVVKELKKISTI